MYFIHYVICQIFYVHIYLILNKFWSLTIESYGRSYNKIYQNNQPLTQILKYNIDQ